MARKVIPVCRRCGQVPQAGFRDGFWLRGVFFCGECQRGLLCTYPGGPDYPEFMAVVKETLERSFPQPWGR